VSLPPAIARSAEHASSPRRRLARAYADPYLAGVALGLVLLGVLVVTGRGLGASGAFAAAASGVTHAVAPEVAESSPYFSRYLGGAGPWRDWLLFELAGVALGGLLSAWLAGRLRRQVERGPRLSSHARLGLAFAGGAVMAVGAVLARGCTSGLALTGGALLSAGAWLFMIAAFAGAYLMAPLLRRSWR
jgi:uncharacterized protein